MKKILKTFWSCIILGKHYRTHNKSNFGKGTYDVICADCDTVLETKTI